MINIKRKNNNIQNKLNNWEEQLEMKSQQNLRNQELKMINNYTNRISSTNYDEDNLYKNSDDLTNKNSYMKYELNNTFNDKDSSKNIK